MPCSATRRTSSPASGDVNVQPRQLLDLTIGRGVTDAGVRGNVEVAIRYIEAWLRGLGAVAINNLMEDAATAEISRSQIWQWIRQDRVTEEGTAITHGYVDGLVDEMLQSVERTDGDRFDEAAKRVPLRRPVGHLRPVPHDEGLRDVPRRDAVAGPRMVPPPGHAQRRHHSYMTTAPAAEAFIERVDPYWVISMCELAAASASSVSPGPSWPNRNAQVSGRSARRRERHR